MTRPDLSSDDYEALTIEMNRAAAHVQRFRESLDRLQRHGLSKPMLRRLAAAGVVTEQIAAQLAEQFNPRIPPPSRMRRVKIWLRWRLRRAFGA